MIDADVLVPVRRGHGPLHLSEPTGRGYQTVCGRTLAGANLSVPMPKIRLQAHIYVHWRRCFDADPCRTCLKAATS
jgi:hypothetical protein